MTRVARYETPDWPVCEWNPRVGHIWSGPLGKIVARSNGAWKPGMGLVLPRGNLLPRFATIERTYRRRTLPHELVGRPYEGTTTGLGNFDGGLQGAMIYLDFAQVPRNIAWLDGVIERHPVCAFNFDTGEPLTPAELGHPEYRPLRNNSHAEPPFQLWQFESTRIGDRCEFWQRYDPAHLQLAYACAVGLHDPVAPWWIDVVASDVAIAKSLDGQATGSLGQELGNARGGARGSAYAGEVRARAWEIGAQTQGYVLFPDEQRWRWLNGAIEFEDLIMSEAGAFTRDGGNHDAYQGHPWIVTPDGEAPMPQTWEAETWWEGCFMCDVLEDAAVALGDPVSFERMRSILRRRKRVHDQLPQRSGQYGTVGVPKFLVVAKDGVLVDEITEGFKPGLNSYTGNFLAQCARLGIR